MTRCKGMAADRTAAIQPLISNQSQPVTTQRFRPSGHSQEPSRSVRQQRPTTPMETNEGFAVAPTRMTPTITTLLLRIQSEYREMPGLKLTEAQARRLWNLDGNTCSLVLTMLLEQRFLRRTASGTYVRATV